jgi:RND family efflux transporter MFP subunit
MKKIFNKFTVLGLAIFIFIAVIVGVNFPHKLNSNAEAVNVKTVSPEIMADGSVQSNSQASLHFQTGGKLVYLPVKEGDKVYEGQIIAKLDTYALQKQIQLTANTYQTVKNSTDQVNENQQAGVLEGQQRVSLDTTNKQGYSSIPETNVIYDNVKRIVDNAALAQNSAQLNIDLANYALSLALLTSPINGIVTHLDVNTAQTNITSATSFTVADPNDLIFKANVAETNINYISEGSSVILKINGQQIKGVVEKTYPTRITTQTGEGAYVVDISSDDFVKMTKMGQSGTVLIKSNIDSKSILVPTWTVLNGKNLWVLNNGKPELRNVKVGRMFGKETEIIEGLISTDKLILNPEQIANSKYASI